MIQKNAPITITSAISRTPENALSQKGTSTIPEGPGICIQVNYITYQTNSLLSSPFVSGDEYPLFCGLFLELLTANTMNATDTINNAANATIAIIIQILSSFVSLGEVLVHGDIPF